MILRLDHVRLVFGGEVQQTSCPLSDFVALVYNTKAGTRERLQVTWRETACSCDAGSKTSANGPR